MPTMEYARLEDFLMQQYPSMRYSEAKNLVLESRRHLKMSRIQKWDEPLRIECQRRYGLVMQIADTDEAVLRLMETPTLATKPTSTPEQHGEHTNSTTSQSDDTTSSRTNSEPEPLPNDKENIVEAKTETIPDLQSDPFPRAKEEEEMNQTIEKKEAEVESYDHNEDDNSDCSQCFTTAQEVGISEEAIAIAIAEAEKAEADDLKFVEEHNNESQEVLQKTKQKPATGIAQPATSTKTSKTDKNLEDQVTIDTAENSELSGVPTIIYIRATSEVPANEPLGESYNIPLPLLLANAKKTRVRKLREKIVNRLKRWGLYRRNKTKLSEDDHEVHFQTLVDL